MHTLRRYAFPVFALLMLALPALPVPDFWITQSNYIGLYALVALGLVLLTGVAGLTSFGQAAFVGVGAYTAAYLAVKLSGSPWLALLLGIAALAIVRRRDRSDHAHIPPKIEFAQRAPEKEYVRIIILNQQNERPSLRRPPGPWAC